MVSRELIHPETSNQGTPATARKALSQKATANRLIVNADDFGRSPSINDAIIQAHCDGILTTASLMVNEPSCAQAVALAKQNPKLGVGLHLSLLCGRSALNSDAIPGLITPDNQFGNNPAKVGARYFFSRSLREQLRKEIRAQFDKFLRTGLTMDHVNGHLHLHLHPTVFSILMEEAERLNIRCLRLTFDPFLLNMRIASGFFWYRIVHALIHHWLSARARPVLRKKVIRHTSAVFGLLQNARVDESYILKLLPALPEGDSELYSHPSLDEFKNEFDALVSPRVKEKVKQLGITLIRYQDL